MRRKYIYGPVPSRRLGLSLGIDVIPYKVCSFNCIYCQLGHTTNLTTKLNEYTPVEDILKDVLDFLKKDGKADHLTLGGSGEPTLNSRIDYIIDTLKKMSKIPVTVLTNGSLLFIEKVRRAISRSDIVLPTFSSVNQDTFVKIHRPYPTLKIEQIIKGLCDFRREFPGRIWLEIMLIKDINTTPEEIEGLRKVIKKIKPDRIHLNTVVRPPSEEYARPITIDELQKIKEFIGEGCEVIARFKKKGKTRYLEDTKNTILGMIRRRPVTLDDILDALIIHRNEALKYLDELIAEKKIQIAEHGNKKYYEAVEG